MHRLIIDMVTARKLPAAAVVSIEARSTLDIGRPIPFTKTAAARFEADIADDKEHSVAIVVSSPDFEGRGVLRVERSNVSATPDGTITKVDVQRSGKSVVVRVQMVLLRLVDATSETPPAFGSPQPTWHFESRILNPKGSGPSLFNGSETKTEVSTQRVRILRWKPSKTRIGVSIPTKALPRLGSYNLFFKPLPVAGWTVPGIMGLYMDWMGDRFHKNLNAATEAAGSAYVFCLAFEEDGRMSSYGSSGEGVVELIEEIDFLLRRSVPGAQLQQSPTVERIALSCFSSGCDHLGKIFAKSSFPPLADKLKGVFNFDGHLNDGKFADLIAAIAAWQRGGSDRVVRFYTSESKFDALLDGVAGVRAPGPHGSFEFRSTAKNPAGEPSLIYLSAPEPFWKSYDPWYNGYMRVHQAFPKLFLTHAHAYSGA